MIYIAVILFLLPILLKTIQSSELSLKTLLPTFITYSIWFIFSYGLILSNISSQYYLYFFYPFPFVLLIYELQVAFKKRHSLIFNKYLLYLSVFLTINLLINLFTYNYISNDNVSYMKWAIDAFNHNGFIESRTYKFNSFYYLATMFGNYRIPAFYSVLTTYIIGTIIYIFLFKIIKEKFINLEKWPFIILLSLLISGYVNSSWSLQINWSIGFTMVIGYLLIFMKLNKEKYSLINDIFIDVLLIFSLNFSATGIVVSILLWVFLKLYICLKYKKMNHVFSIFFLLIYCLSLIIEFSHIIFIILYIFSIISLIFLLILHFKKLKTKNNQSILINKIIKWNNRIDKKYWIYKFIFINLAIIVYGIIKVLINIYVHNINLINFDMHLTDLLSIFIISLVLINILLITKQKEFMVILCVLLITWLIYSGIIWINPKIVMNYITSRVKYVWFAFGLFFIPIILMNRFLMLKWNHWGIFIKIVYMSASASLLFTTFNRRISWFIDIRWTYKVNVHLSKQNYKLVEKYKNQIYNNSTFSMYHIPFNKMQGEMYYNGRLLKPGEEPHLYFGEHMYWWEKYIKHEIVNMYKNVETTTTYKVLVLDNNSSLMQNSNVISNYLLLKEQTKDMSIWLLK